mgnify:CR=1 FL=1
MKALKNKERIYIMKLKSRGQASLEAIFMFAFLAVLVTLLYVNSNQVLKASLENDKEINQVDALNNAIKEIEAMPESSFKIIEFQLPSTTKNFFSFLARSEIMPDGNGQRVTGLINPALIPFFLNPTSADFNILATLP